MGRTKSVGKVEPVNKLWLSAKEAMAYLGCSDKLLEKLRNNAEISFSQYNKRTIWYDLKSIERFIERNRVVRTTLLPLSSARQSIAMVTCSKV